MKCPTCGEELQPSKKDSRYMLCHDCRKKFRIPEKLETVDRQANNPPRKAPKPAPKEASAMLNNALVDELTEQTQIFSRQDVRAALRKANEERLAEKAALKTTPQTGKPPVRKGNSAASIAESESDNDGEYHFRYANIPPKSVREKQEREMRRAYDELLSIGKEERASRKHGLFGKRNT